ncbi:MAG: hypothetical protein CMP65_00580, partial [Flavobacteriales bacterium]|nr:hypothetical protein [Flavobacteriales bacterium]
MTSIYSQCEFDEYTDWSNENITMTVGEGALPFGIIIDCIAVSNQDCPTGTGVITIDWSLEDPLNDPLPSGPLDFFVFTLYDNITNVSVASSAFIQFPTESGTVTLNAAPGDYYIEFTELLGITPSTLEYNQVLTIADEGNVEVEEVSHNIISPACPGFPGSIEVIVTGGSATPDYYIEVAGGGGQLPNAPTQNDADDVYNNVNFPPGSTDPNDYLITFTVGDNNIENGCSETFQVQFTPPDIEETEITITHETCPGEGDGSFEVTFDNDDGLVHIFQLYNVDDSDPLNISAILSDIEPFVGAGAGSVLFSEPISAVFNGEGEPDGRPFAMTGGYTALIGSCIYFEIANDPPYDGINEPQPLLLYTLEEPVIDLNDVTLTQPFCFEQNGPPNTADPFNPSADPFNAGDDDAGGIISFPISSLSGTENLNAVFGLDYGPE